VRAQRDTGGGGQLVREQRLLEGDRRRVIALVELRAVVASGEELVLRWPGLAGDQGATGDQAP
jgi:hypothetical protein